MTPLSGLFHRGQAAFVVSFLFSLTFATATVKAQPLGAEVARERSILGAELERISSEAAREHVRQLKEASNSIAKGIEVFKGLQTQGGFHDECDPGSEAAKKEVRQKMCWQSCEKDNWSVSYCKNKCGVDSNAGSGACWSKCGSDNWSVSYCKGQCGVSTVAGIEACYEKCRADNWSVSYCESTCGI